MADPPDDPVRKENDDPARVARTDGDFGHHNAIALGIFSTPITLIKIIRLTITSDDAVMKDYDTDWQDSGSVASEPEWVFGKPSASVSHTKGTMVSVKGALDIYPKDADETPCSFVGTAAFGSITFNGALTLKGGVVNFLASSAPIKLSPDTVAKLTFDIAWKFTAIKGGATFAAGSSWGHTFYTTMAAPIAVPSPDAGSTRKRMYKAVDLVGGTGSNDPHTIVASLMGKIKFYTLVKNPAVPSRYNHPTYFNSVGGAWPICDYIDNYAECQAIVRWVRALIKQVGCPGTADLVTIWADPTIDGGKTTRMAENDPSIGLDTSKTVGSATWDAALVDRYPEKGKVYDVEEFTSNYMGLNRYEACLRFKHGGTTKFYGGGAGVYSNEDEVLTAFYALVWVTFQLSAAGKKQAKVQDVVRRWRDQSGTLIKP
jgi:hypothetical protein